jgi:hypothetical protein
MCIARRQNRTQRPPWLGGARLKEIRTGFGDDVQSNDWTSSEPGTAAFFIFRVIPATTDSPTGETRQYLDCGSGFRGRGQRQKHRVRTHKCARQGDRFSSGTDGQQGGYLTRNPGLQLPSSSGSFRQRPTLPPGKPGSTIGAGRLNGGVRNGNRCDPLAIVTGMTLEMKEAWGGGTKRMGRNGSGFRVKLLPGARLLTPNQELETRNCG